KQTATREKQTRISVADTPLVPYFFANAAGGNPTAPETRGNPRTGFRIALGREGEGPTDRPSGAGPTHRSGGNDAPPDPGPRRRGSSSRKAAKATRLGARASARRNEWG